jgi:hypothetical protein
MNYDYYRHTEFVPAFNLSMTSPPSGNLLGQEMSAVCGANSACLYDFAATGNPSLAASTLAAAEWSAEARHLAAPGKK